MNEVFQRYLEEENEVLRKLHQGDFSKFSPFGIIFDKFTNKDIAFSQQIMPVIKTKLECETFRENVVRLKLNECKKEKLELINKIKKSMESCGVVNPLQIAKLTLVDDKINSLCYESLILDASNNFVSVWKLMSVIQSDMSYFEENHLIYYIVEILYSDYKNNIGRRFHTKKQNRLVELYQSKGYDLNKVDNQYNAYNLLTINDNIAMKTGNTPKVYDKRISTHLLITEISINTFNLLSNLKGNGCITQLSLRPDYNIVGDSIVDLSILLEEVEVGNVFSFSDLDTIKLSKLYSENYDDLLWISIDTSNITFEEMVDDCIIYEDSIVTQVVHLEYNSDQDGEYINHIDHEYIFYTLEEYEERKKNHTVKGEALTRFKTFKVDNSKIPFILDDGSFFIYRILAEFFTNKDLLKEYFKNVSIK
ncbi:hypothetical protein [Vibrio cholerae]|uniref:hypothetical protein n=1 Tax=Vibrio cholerae TaxID=666 RepID=UPI001A9FDB28|nr:hypothetical protein [Vibrio cholerae]MBO1368104.1 hypothetical protein [Vibrio cholerae]MBO1371842.1 hypothetical protein [Vibrio cholerae]MBO1375570.1 hypothetical protein [Vibrio cholerae]MBO1379310.1 hypothetical protein [Vibrio cholerae]MBO1409116.1 hypothetical protein [Vibrio cholerae]